ncbi:hypothetical protein P5V15_000038 [Pogonomyrmex californicus]
MGSVTETLNVKHSEETHTNVAKGFHERVANGNASTDVLREMTVNVLRKKIQEMREDVLGHVNNRINDMMKSDKKDELPDKEFLERNSLLTDLFEIPHIRTVYNMFMVTLMLLFVSTIVSDIMDSETIHIGTNTLRKGFTKFPTCVYIWFFMQTATFSLYVFFNIWAYQRLNFMPKSFFRKIWDYGWLSTFILYQVLFIVLPVRAVINEELSVGSSVIILAEQLRMMMKTHAFVRSTASRFLSYKPHNETPRPNGPKFSHYLYFLFAPTLVYRDEYPRTKKIRWTVVARNFAEVGLAIFYLALIFERLIMPTFQVFGTRHLDQKWFIRSIIETSIPGILYFVAGQYLLLHSWMNAWAEMLRFADRLFYKDWWNCTTYHTYYRTWNLVVHDWLYTYVYKDMYDIVVPRNKTLSAAAVFLISAVFHEYVIAFMFRFFYPVMFVLFGGIGFAMFFVRKIVTSNIFMWFSLTLGNGIMFTLYSIEIYARFNCPPHPNYYLDLFIPRSWTCSSQFDV